MNQSSNESAIYWSIALIPVQDWISEARRSRDLLAGSRLLSWMMAHLLEDLTERDGLEVTAIVPATPDGGWSKLATKSFAEALDARYSIPNRASGRCSTGVSLDRAKQVFQALEEEVLRRRWKSWVDESTRGDPFNKKFQGQAWNRITPHLKDVPCPLRLIWCLQRIQARGDERERDGLGMKEIDKLYAAVKRWRPIDPWQGNPVGKCGQCGKREAIGPESWHAWRGFHRKLDALPEVRFGYRFDEGERLCSVCLVKRLAGYLAGGDFASTAEIAGANWRKRLEAANLDGALLSFRRVARQVPGFEADEPEHPFANDIYPLLYSTTVERHLRRARVQRDAAKHAGTDDLERKLGDSRIEKLEDLRQARRRLTVAIQSLPPQREISTEPPSYLAVMALDGDNMGEAVRADLLHLPKAVGEFANDLHCCVKGADGRAFYVGGDEALCLLPIEGCIQQIEKIRAIWDEKMRGIQPKPPTLSVGLALFDFESPLSAAIAAAREALRDAKNLRRKNGLGVAVQTASGSVWKCVDHWGAGWERTAKAVDLIRNGKLASGWAYDVESFLRTLDPEDWNVQITREAIRAEVRRITSRRLGSREAEAEEEEDRRLESIWKHLSGEHWWERLPESAVAGGEADRMHLIAFLTRESGPEAGGQGGTP